MKLQDRPKPSYDWFIGKVHVPKNKVNIEEVTPFKVEYGYLKHLPWESTSDMLLYKMVHYTYVYEGKVIEEWIPWHRFFTKFEIKN